MTDWNDGQGSGGGAGGYNSAEEQPGQSQETIQLVHATTDGSNIRLPDLCAQLFNFAFQLRQADLFLQRGDDTEPGRAESPIDDLDADDGDAVIRRRGPGGGAESAPAGGGFLGQDRESKLPTFARDAEELRRTIDQLFTALDDGGRRAGRPQENVRLAKYALAAYFDELILAGQLPVRESWSGRPLQLDYFNDFNAGEEFYNKLDSLRDALRTGEDLEKRDVLEVFFLCLCFGFRGKYADAESMEKRKVLIDKLARDLKRTAPADAEPLSPKAVSISDNLTVERLAPLWLVPALSIAALFLLSWLLGSIVGAQADEIKNIKPSDSTSSAATGTEEASTGDNPTTPGSTSTEGAAE